MICKFITKLLLKISYKNIRMNILNSFPDFEAET